MKRYLLFISLPAIASAAPMATVLDQARRRLQAEFAKMDTSSPTPLPWSFAATPPLPDFSSTTTPRPYAVYGYATRHDVDLSDGERIARAWGAVHMSPAGAALQFESLTTKLTEVGVQGVRPLRAGEAPTDADREIAERWIALGTGDQPPEVKRVYCFWASTNGVIAGALPSGARSFIASLHCR